MKKAYRKDVVIARLVFAAFCVVVVLLIVCAVMFARNRISKQEELAQETETESQMQETETETQAPMEEQEPDIEEEEQQEPTPTVVTTSDVNLRTEPNTSCDVITVIPSGTSLEFLGEEDGWASVSYGGDEGYVSMDYVAEAEDSDSE